MNEFKCRNIDILRKSKGLTVAEMMKELGHTREMYYQSWKKGSIRLKEILQLHEFFGVSTDCILDLKEIIVNKPEIVPVTFDIDDTSITESLGKIEERLDRLAEKASRLESILEKTTLEFSGVDIESGESDGKSKNRSHT